MTRWLVTGARGQLGRAVVDLARARGEPVDGLGRDELDVTDAAAVDDAVAAHRPDVVVHCAAWTDVDGCERDPERAMRVNGDGAAHVARACRGGGAGLVHVSTDFVFGGEDRREPYPTDAPTAPICSYGRSKLRGELSVLDAPLPARAWVVRTSWLFGPGGRNFPRAILERARRGEPLAVVDDQIGSPTYAPDLAEALLDLGASGAAPGIYHAANSGSCSWYDFAAQIVEQAGIAGVELRRISSAELDRPAPRPSYSVLDCSRLAAVRGRSLPTYQDALRRYLEENP